MAGSETRRPRRAAGAESRPEEKAIKPAPTRNAVGRFVSASNGIALKPALSSPQPARRKARAKAPPKAAARWTAARQRTFLAALAETANVTQSARAAKVSETTVYRRRRESAEFRALWEEAAREGVARLEMILLHRAIYGVREDQWYGGKKVGSILKFNDRNALAIVTAHRNREAARHAPDIAPEPEMPTEELRARLKAKLSEMNKRMGGAG